MGVISMKQLLEAGVHFGHQTRRWNPKMAEYIYTERNGIYIIDLQKSVGKRYHSFRRNQKTGAGCDPHRGRALWDVLCKREMVRRNADQLQNDPQPDQEIKGHRKDAGRWNL